MVLKNENSSVNMEDNKISTLLRRSKKVKFVETGADAVVFKIVEFDNNVRIVRYVFGITKSINNATIEIINDYRTKTLLFIRTYDVVVLNAKELPRELLPPRNIHIESERLQQRLEQLLSTDWVYIYIMENAGIQVADDPFWKEIEQYDVVCMLFNFLYGIWVARTTSGSFSHNDVHERNLTIARTDGLEKTYFVVGSVQFTLETIFQLHLIDYDAATWPGHKQTVDIDNMLQIIPTIGDMTRKEKREISKFLSVWQEPTWAEDRERVRFADETDALKTILTEHPLFNVLKSRKRVKRLETCIQCNREAIFKTDNETIETKYFCSNKCNKQYHFF